MTTPPIRPLIPTPGAPLDPDEIVGRDELIQHTWDRLAQQSLLLTEPRRFGKTAFLTKLRHQPPPGWRTTYQSFEGVSTRGEMVALTIAALREHKGLLARVVERLGASIEVDARLPAVSSSPAPSDSTTSSIAPDGPRPSSITSERSISGP